MKMMLPNLVRVGVLAMAIATPLVASPALALAVETETFYYSDASKTVFVGYRLHDCNGRWYRDGQITPYYDVVVSGC